MRALRISHGGFGLWPNIGRDADATVRRLTLFTLHCKVLAIQEPIPFVSLVDNPGLESRMELRDALSQIAEIRQRMAQGQLFRGYRSATTAFSGVMAALAAERQAS